MERGRELQGREITRRVSLRKSWVWMASEERQGTFQVLSLLRQLWVGDTGRCKAERTGEGGPGVALQRGRLPQVK